MPRSKPVQSDDPVTQRPPNFEERLKTKLNSKVYYPKSIEGATHDPMMSNPRAGRPYQYGSSVTDPATGDRLFMPWGGSSGIDRFQLYIAKTKQKFYGTFNSQSYWDRPLKTYEVEAIMSSTDRQNLSRSEYDASRLAELFRIAVDAPLLTGEFPSYNHKPVETIVIDSRPEMPGDPNSEPTEF